MKLQRILKMTPSEIAFRGRQHAHILAERITVKEGSAPHVETCRFNLRECDAELKQAISRLGTDEYTSAKLQLQKALERSMTERFFTSVSDDQSIFLTVEHLRRDEEGHAFDIISSANAVCNSQFDILGYGRLSFGDTINWQLDPIAARESSLIHWSKLDPLSFDEVGDSKVVWELNRHQWILDLGQAYRLTGDARYAEQFAFLLRSWMNANPPCYGINWCSALEAAMRIIAWCWGLFLFRGSKALSPDLFYTVLGWIQRHAHFIERNYSLYFSPNTHLTVEALSLYYVGTVLPQLQGAERWRLLASQTLNTQLLTQVNPDGGYFEQSTRYQYYTVEIYLHFVILARRNNQSLPPHVEEKLRSMVNYLLQLQRPDGTLPQIGDTDGGWLLPFVRRHNADYRPLFSTAAILFNDSNFSWAADTIAIESRWLLGNNVVLPSPQPPKACVLDCLSDSGYAVMRSGWGRKAHQMIFDFGPLGCPVSSGHGHTDLLSLQCSGWGENFLVDPGTYCYTADRSQRDYFRSSHAHSTLLVDGKNQAIPDGAFSWRSRPRAQLNQSFSNSRYSLVDASHCAYGSTTSPITHRRRVLFVEQRYWLVVDDVCGSGEHRVDLHYQFAPLTVKQIDPAMVRAEGIRSSLVLCVVSKMDLYCTLCNGSEHPLRGWYSANYGERVPAPHVSFSAENTLPLRLVTVICPVSKESSPLQTQSTLSKATFEAEKLLNGQSDLLPD